MGSYAVGGDDDDDDVAIINNEQDLFVSCFWALYWRAGDLVGDFNIRLWPEEPG